MTALSSPPIDFAMFGPFLLTQMQLDDIELVCEIEKLSFSLPWSAETYRHEVLHNKLASYWVARPTQYPVEKFGMPPILCHGGYWLLGREIHVATIATHPDWRRHHFGEWLLLNMLATARGAGACSATLEVRPSNAAAIGLYSKLGFVQVGVRKKYYPDNREDALLLTLFDLDDQYGVWRELSERRRLIDRDFRVKFAPHPLERRESRPA